MLAESRTTYRFGLVGLGLIDLFAIIGSWIWVSTHVSRPVKTLVSASNKAFISGHFHNTGNTGPAELKTLSNAFERLTNHLGDQLEAERNKVKKQELEARNELWKLAHTDVLTQGPNRSQFNETFEKLIAKCNDNKEAFDIFIVGPIGTKTPSKVYKLIFGSSESSFLQKTRSSLVEGFDTLILLL